MKLATHILQKFDTLVRFSYQAGRYYIQWTLSGGNKQSINRYERRIYSQNGEDGIILYIFKKIGIKSKYFVEIGAGDGSQCNTRYLRKIGWTGKQIDVLGGFGIEKHFVTVENVEQVLSNLKVPLEFDLLSIDIDGNDYWLWRAIKKFKPRVVVIEYNALLGKHKAFTIPYNPKFSWDGSDFFGASLQALAKLAMKKGYQLVGTNKTGVNAFFVEKKLAEKYFLNRPVKDFYHLPKYNLQANGEYGYRNSGRIKEMVSV